MAYSDKKSAQDIYDSLGISDKPFEKWWKEQEEISSAAVTPKVSRSAERQEPAQEPVSTLEYRGEAVPFPQGSERPGAGDGERHVAGPARPG